MLTQLSLSSPQFIELLRQWYRQHILPDPDNCTPSQLAAVLLADGVWYAKVFGIHRFTPEQQLAAANLLFNEALV